jgi:hypothetical protein
LKEISPVCVCFLVKRCAVEEGGSWVSSCQRYSVSSDMELSDVVFGEVWSKRTTGSSGFRIIVEANSLKGSVYEQFVRNLRNLTLLDSLAENVLTLARLEAQQ